MDAKKWSLMCVGTVLLLCLAAASLTAYVDPYFHFHSPVPTAAYALSVSDERYVNNGILRHFDYDAVITGTSMTECFKASEFDRLFGAHSVKVPFSGASYREVEQNLDSAFRYADKIQTILRGLDYNKINQSPDYMRRETYPEYLYDENPLNDIFYLLNRSVLLSICHGILQHVKAGGGGGMTSFDDYANWSGDFQYGAEAVREFMRDRLASEILPETQPLAQVLTEEEIRTIEENIDRNVLSVAEAHPESEFYYFFPPYSVYYWMELYMAGEIEKQIDAEEIALRRILDCENIQLFSFNMNTDITTNFDNYKDYIHYGGWINSDILHWIKNGEYRLTRENYQAYLAAEREFYGNYDYAALYSALWN